MYASLSINLPTFRAAYNRKRAKKCSATNKSSLFGELTSKDCIFFFSFAVVFMWLQGASDDDIEASVLVSSRLYHHSPAARGHNVGKFLSLEHR